MENNNKMRLIQGKRVFFEEKSTYAVELKNVKSKKNIATVNCTFAPDGNDSLDKILEKWIKAIDLQD